MKLSELVSRVGRLASSTVSPVAGSPHTLLPLSVGCVAGSSRNRPDGSSLTMVLPAIAKLVPALDAPSSP